MRISLFFLLGMLAEIRAQSQSVTFTTLYSFLGGADGSMGGTSTYGGAPDGVSLGKNGKLYGATY